MRCTNCPTDLSIRCLSPLLSALVGPDEVKGRSRDTLEEVNLGIIATRKAAEGGGGGGRGPCAEMIADQKRPREHAATTEQ